MKKLETLAQERGKPLERIIPPEVNRYGVVGAAKKLGYAPSTISKWLDDNGYVSSTTWGKAITPQERADIDRVVAQVNAERVAAGLPTIEEEEAAEWARPEGQGQL